MSQETPVQKKSSIKFLAVIVICIILAVSLVGVSAVYLSNQGQLSEKDSTIASLNDDISALQLQLSQVPNATSTYVEQIAYLNQQLANLNQQLDDANASYASVSEAYSSLLQIVQMRSSGIMYEGPFIQEANTTTILYNNPVDYAGVVVVEATANSTSTFAQVMYTFGNYNFDYNQTLGANGTAAFPILPGDVLLVIGNLDGQDSNAVNATATYYF